MRTVITPYPAQRQIAAKGAGAVAEEPSLEAASGAWGMLPVFSAGDVATGGFLRLSVANS